VIGPEQEADDREEILNVRAVMMKRRGPAARAIDAAGRGLARPWFLLILLLLSAVWISFNLLLPAGRWDPHPYLLLATVTSTLAPFLTLLVLMRQHRDGRIEELREEIELQVALRVEREVTLLVRLLDDMRVRLGIDTELDRAPLEAAKHSLDPGHLLDHLERHLDRLEGETFE
jgi:uncharacterized membrane protein